jgi:ribosomal protein S18 acetylase RimI-like enzyme
MALTYRSVLEHGLDPAASLITVGFSDYVVPIVLSAAGLLAMARQDSVDLDASRVALEDGEPVGVALIARRGRASRLAAMAVVPAARGRGVGEAWVRRLLEEARARGGRSMSLEVVEQNGRAVRLYERCGFRVVRRLVGYEGKPVVEGAPAPLVETDTHEVARLLVAHGPPDLPWQLSGETLAQATPPATAYRLEGSFLVLADPAAPRVTVRALVTLPEARRRGMAWTLLRAVVARHPDREWRVPAIWPETPGGLFERLGLRRSELSQWQMSVTLGDEPPDG